MSEKQKLQLGDADLLKQFSITPCTVLLCRDQVHQYFAKVANTSIMNKQRNYKPGPKSRTRNIPETSTKIETCVTKTQPQNVTCKRSLEETSDQGHECKKKLKTIEEKVTTKSKHEVNIQLNVQKTSQRLLEKSKRDISSFRETITTVNPRQNTDNESSKQLETVSTKTLRHSIIKNKEKSNKNSDDISKIQKNKNLKSKVNKKRKHKNVDHKKVDAEKVVSNQNFSGKNIVIQNVESDNNYESYVEMTVATNIEEEETSVSNSRIEEEQTSRPNSRMSTCSHTSKKSSIHDIAHKLQAYFNSFSIPGYRKYDNVQYLTDTDEDFELDENVGLEIGDVMSDTNYNSDGEPINKSSFIEIEIKNKTVPTKIIDNSSETGGLEINKSAQKSVLNSNDNVIDIQNDTTELNIKRDPVVKNDQSNSKLTIKSSLKNNKNSKNSKSKKVEKRKLTINSKMNTLSKVKSCFDNIKNQVVNLQMDESKIDNSTEVSNNTLTEKVTCNESIQKQAENVEIDDSIIENCESIIKSKITNSVELSNDSLTAKVICNESIQKQADNVEINESITENCESIIKSKITDSVELSNDSLTAKVICNESIQKQADNVEINESITENCESIIKSKITDSVELSNDSLTAKVICNESIQKQADNVEINESITENCESIIKSKITDSVELSNDSLTAKVMCNERIQNQAENAQIDNSITDNYESIIKSKITDSVEVSNDSLIKCNESIQNQSENSQINIISTKSTENDSGSSKNECSATKSIDIKAKSDIKSIENKDKIDKEKLHQSQTISDVKTDKKSYKFEGVQDLVSYLSTCKTNTNLSTLVDESEPNIEENTKMWINSINFRVENNSSNKIEGNKCLKCGEYYTSKYLFKHHSCISQIKEQKSIIETSVKSNRYVCKCCSYSFLFADTLYSHYKESHGITEYLIDKIVISCHLCSKHFISKTSLELHLTFEHFFNENLPNFDINSVQFKCGLCRLLFKTGHKLLEHNFKKHGKVYNFKDIKIVKESEVLNELIDSVDSMELKNSVECDELIDLTDSVELNKNVEINELIESEDNTQDTQDITNSSEIESIDFKKTIEIKESIESKDHIKEMSGPQFWCMICNVYMNNTEMEGHVRFDHNGCNVCQKFFNWKSDLFMHEINHNLGRIFFFKCYLCNNEFKNVQEVLLHGENVHKLKLVPSNCTRIEKIIPENTICLFCRSQFDNMKSLNEHLVDAHNICDVCFNIYSSKCKLLEHIITHTMYQCPICRKKFSETYDLHRHCKNIHDIIISPSDCLVNPTNNQLTQKCVSKIVQKNKLQKQTNCTNQNVTQESVATSSPEISEKINSSIQSNTTIISHEVIASPSQINNNSKQMVTRMLTPVSSPLQQKSSSLINVNETLNQEGMVTPSQINNNSSMQKGTKILTPVPAVIISQNLAKPIHNYKISQNLPEKILTQNTRYLFQEPIASTSKMEVPFYKPKPYVVCLYCDLKFESLKLLNRHLFQIHGLSQCVSCKEITTLSNSGQCSQCSESDVTIIGEM